MTVALAIENLHHCQRYLVCRTPPIPLRILSRLESVEQFLASLESNRTSFGMPANIVSAPTGQRYFRAGELMIPIAKEGQDE